MRLKTILYCLCFIPLLYGCNELTKKTKTIKLAHGLDTKHSVHIAMLKMSDDLYKLSNGTLKINVYPSQQLGTERECLELLQIGSLEMTKVSVGVLENFAPKMKVLGLPYLFRDRQHSFDVLDGPIGQELLDNGTKFWLKGLGYYDAGSRSFYSKDKAIRTPADLKGLKVRVMESVSAMNMVRSFGGSPTPISWGELYTSLQQGVVDAAENNPPSFYLSRHYEVCKHYTLDEHTVVPDVLVGSTHFWNALTEQEQEWVKIAVKNSVKYQRELWLDAEEEALTEVEKAGVEIIRPDKTLFSDMVKPIYDEVEKDPEVNKLIQRIRNTK
ncbi:TRAP transporter substrate-binding protein [Wenyingzhuangia marina]|uniref:Tripartite ATP-independent transporter solute receptor, DctP family n=1 Tax=Wenyingzhuangia marina TaxID=1195760 RepID=A0A1M5VYN7_9FLAO|nr:TRAP transporter substrate-binding protein [Wenyingzhuangia marina]GGF77141.1 C4-dicarboxylate ABC transporter substrate-binding protein [Wenyingzhuangia marina]SHH80104.1 tripartite ATP-independent transporter solute receptor, DctP family [Wenyingzhuangia marina]